MDSGGVNAASALSWASKASGSDPGSQWIRPAAWRNSTERSGSPVTRTLPSASSSWSGSAASRTEAATLIVAAIRSVASTSAEVSSGENREE